MASMIPTFKSIRKMNVCYAEDTQLNVLPSVYESAAILCFSLHCESVHQIHRNHCYCVSV